MQACVQHRLRCTNSAVATCKLVLNEEDVHKLRKQTGLCTLQALAHCSRVHTKVLGTLQACAHYKLAHSADSDVLQPDAPVPGTQPTEDTVPYSLYPLLCCV